MQTAYQRNEKRDYCAMQEESLEKLWIPVFTHVYRRLKYNKYILNNVL